MNHYDLKTFSKFQVTTIVWTSTYVRIESSVRGQMNHPGRQCDPRLYAADPSVVQVPGVVVLHSWLLQSRRAEGKRENTTLSISPCSVQSLLGLTVRNQQSIPTVSTPSTATHA